MSTNSTDGIRSHGIDFCTFGMFIIDEIEFEEPEPSVNDIMGGAGSYAVVGARMVAGQEHSRSVGWIVNVGSDFPESIRETITSWNTHCLFRENMDRLTTRGWNGYGPNEKRDFKYLTPKIRLDHNSLSEGLLLSKSFHMVCSPARCCEIIQGVLERRRKLIENGNLLASRRPIFVWEPVPDLCRPEELSRFYEALKHVHVVSPNEYELAQFFGKDTWDSGNRDDRAIADNIVNSGIGPDGQGLLVIRAGKEGCYAFSRGRSLALPALQHANVVDPTGAGNTFLGALAQALVSAGPIHVINSELEQWPPWLQICTEWEGDGIIPSALICATVAASFSIEQVGMPQISSDNAAELWNGTGYTERLRVYTKQLKEIFDKSTHAI
ncbi:hypothetical protein AJ80_07092 [Polytolypa hystricis UAMH7299]|uniref:Carbohydrate kinase PfkB domain-containing protein n=1 Tax=Polytolypa hystricis (strain UAMH7299) TaxID=1447883 RepID=A0A2B7XQP9_POLH7|nr:hypothetical protein AJ80_07092 [Polytolypa hystricis UAMH7299]